MIKNNVSHKLVNKVIYIERNNLASLKSNKYIGTQYIYNVYIYSTYKSPGLTQSRESYSYIQFVNATSQDVLNHFYLCLADYRKEKLSLIIIK